MMWIQEEGSFLSLVKMINSLLLFISVMSLVLPSEVHPFLQDNDSLYRFKRERRIPMSPAQAYRYREQGSGNRVLEPVDHNRETNEPFSHPLNTPFRDNEVNYNAAPVDTNPLPPPPAPMPTADSGVNDRESNFVPMPTRMSYEEEINTNDENNKVIDNSSNDYKKNEVISISNAPNLVNDAGGNSGGWNGLPREGENNNNRRVVVGFELAVTDHDSHLNARPTATSAPLNTEYYKVLNSPAQYAPAPVTRYADEESHSIDVYNGQASTAKMKNCLLNDMDKIWESRMKKADQVFVPRNELESTCKPFIEKIEELRTQCLDALEVLMLANNKKKHDPSKRSWWKFIPFVKK